MKKILIAAAAGLALSAGSLMAQEVKPVIAQPAPAPTPAPAPAPAPKPLEPIRWSEADFQKAATMLTGVWRSKGGVQTADKGDNAEIVLAAAPVRYPGLPDTLYFEVARVDSMNKPFRQGIWQIYRNKGEMRMRTFEFRRVNGEMFSAVSAWAAPDAFPSEISVTDLIGTLDLKLTLAADSLSGKTPHPYPTGTLGAVEMTSEFRVTKDSFATMDRGYGADGKIVWGPAEGKSTDLTRSEPPMAVTKSDDGLVIIDYKKASTGDPATNGWRVAVYHTASLMNGVVFDSSRDRDRPFILRLGDPMPGGVARGLEGIKQGDLRRLIVPPSLGFGEAGHRRSKVPPNATLFYEIEAVTTEAPPPPGSEQPANQMPEIKGAGGAQIVPIDKPPFPVDPNTLPTSKPAQNPPK